MVGGPAKCMGRLPAEGMGNAVGERMSSPPSEIIEGERMGIPLRNAGGVVREKGLRILLTLSCAAIWGCAARWRGSKRVKCRVERRHPPAASRKERLTSADSLSERILEFLTVFTLDVDQVVAPEEAGFELAV